MKMNIQNAENENLLLSLDANAYLGGGLRHQNINVFVNDQQIAVWEMAGRKWYEAQIPASVVGDGLLNISFQISHPTAPCEVSNSKDCRKLGMAVSELLIKQDMR
ncbi:hypothetical protein LJC24_00705 [Desulfococcaceae bacterium OttesenSCG-928-F15]|nr:hypothetical protein [Desulfococcaceae bacterium OttesenSCG-928-F15]